MSKNNMVRSGCDSMLVGVISELGIFGYFWGDVDKINKQVGHMLRTKLSYVIEGGVAAVLVALDVYLVSAENGNVKKGSSGNRKEG